ncbi:carbohydrate ABC transporter permease [Glycomyces sp. TRM65418]|uniref:carbohydrate ABC transporter permease n=1 Tax=Glycomyces sp. TRM65418 TaxID=2867006 RepID=UPI001CE6EAC5|nr:carbohydrate ABC transporter permease [Glycomyces sp. TRM65418]MCC3761481.1 carbohydrate ABC transporter permease [Glycomyces sp. TRM65418]QZD55579.1 carbohydrate ABC transporter permease [Glycomyces sp. TRM65418]
MKKIPLYLVLLAGALLSLGPYLMTVNAAFKSKQEILTSDPWAPPASPILTNFAEVWSRYDFATFVLNSCVVAVAVTVGQLVFSTLAAYAFARLDFPCRDQLFWAYIATLMVPQIVTLVPTFIIVRELGLVDTHVGLILPFVFGFLMPYGVFLVRQYFKTIPVSIEDAARIDGAGTFTILWRVMVPMAKPILGTLAIISFVNTWNNLLWPLIITHSESTKVITRGIAQMQSQFNQEYHLILAASTMALLPLVVVFLIFQRHIVRSIALSGMK